MSFAFDAARFSVTQITGAVTAIGALGTSAFGLVDAVKLFPAGLPLRGFKHIAAMAKEFAPAAQDAPAAAELSSASLLKVLRSNWIGSSDLALQKSTAKTLIKLRFSAGNAPALAKLTGLDATLLTSVAQKLNLEGATTNQLTEAEQNAYGRFDVLLSAAIDQAYEAAMQLYVSWAKVAACIVSIILAELAAWALGLHGRAFFGAFLVGLIATPLAPIAKDVATAITNAANAVQSVRK